jgi:hypothetical protein
MSRYRKHASRYGATEKSLRVAEFAPDPTEEIEGLGRSITTDTHLFRDDESGSGPRAMAWFKDPAEHVLSVLEVN